MQTSSKKPRENHGAGDVYLFDQFLYSTLLLPLIPNYIVRFYFSIYTYFDIYYLDIYILPPYKYIIKIYIFKKSKLIPLSNNTHTCIEIPYLSALFHEKYSALVKMKCSQQVPCLCHGPEICSLSYRNTATSEYKAAHVRNSQHTLHTGTLLRVPTN